MASQLGHSGDATLSSGSSSSLATGNIDELLRQDRNDQASIENHFVMDGIRYPANTDVESYYLETQLSFDMSRITGEEEDYNNYLDSIPPPDLDQAMEAFNHTTGVPRATEPFDSTTWVPSPIHNPENFNTQHYLEPELSFDLSRITGDEDDYNDYLNSIPPPGHPQAMEAFDSTTGRSPEQNQLEDYLQANYYDEQRETNRGQEPPEPEDQWTIESIQAFFNWHGMAQPAPLPDTRGNIVGQTRVIRVFFLSFHCSNNTETCIVYQHHGGH